MYEAPAVLRRSLSEYQSRSAIVHTTSCRSTRSTIDSVSRSEKRDSTQTTEFNPHVAQYGRNRSFSSLTSRSYRLWHSIPQFSRSLLRWCVVGCGAVGRANQLFVRLRSTGAPPTANDGTAPDMICHPHPSLAVDNVRFVWSSMRSATLAPMRDSPLAWRPRTMRSSAGFQDAIVSGAGQYTAPGG